MATWATENPVGPRPQAQADPKPSKRQKATQSGWDTIRALFTETACLVCPSHLIELHHVVPRSQGGDDLAVNLAPLCHEHHMILEDHSPGWERVAVAVRKYVLLNRARCVYVIGKIGWDRFNARYPLAAARTVGEASQPRPSNGGPDNIFPESASESGPPSESDWDKYERPDERISPWEVDAAQSFEQELSW